jgi:hypothetical protein
MKFRRVAIAFLAGVLPACSLLVDTAGLGGAVGPPPEASAPDGGGAAPEDASDGPVADGAPSDAGAPDARFCDQHDGGAVLYCEDFDGPPLDITRIVVRGGGSVGAAPVADALSPPNALVAKVGAVEAGTTGNAFLLLPSFGLTSKLHVAFDVAVVDGHHVIVSQLDQAVSGATYLSELIGDSTFLLYQEFSSYPDGGGVSVFKWVPPLALGPAWHHADVCFDFGRNTRTVVVDDHPTSGSGLTEWTGSAALQVGVAFAAGGSASQEVHLDNVLVESNDCP